MQVQETRANERPVQCCRHEKAVAYSKNEDGTICINAYKGKKTEIKIPERIGKAPVTLIGGKNGDSVFPQGAAITQIVIPQSMKIIGKCAFYGCTGLTSVVIPDSVKEIGEAALIAALV